jgi:2,5-diamino-6-(ribosylamino)-4(3H)-pyrimidinone 5'-phosphate reductase
MPPCPPLKRGMRNAEYGTQEAPLVTRHAPLVTRHSSLVTGPLPFVFLNLAMTADGKIASANRVVTSFGSRRDLEELYRLRATADAVMSGARTVDGESVDLGPGPPRFRRERQRRGLAEFNLRVIVSGLGSVDPKARIFQRRFSPILVLTSSRVSVRRLRVLRGLADDVCVSGREELDFVQALCWLRQRWKVKRLLCEGGGELNDALFRASLVRRIHLTVCPLVFGGRSAPSIAEGTGWPALAQATSCRLKSRRRVGDEQFLVYEVRPQPR